MRRKVEEREEQGGGKGVRILGDRARIRGGRHGIPGERNRIRGGVRMSEEEE